MSTQHIIRNILALVLGVLIGGVINYGLVQIGYSVFPIPGLDTNNPEAVIKAIPSFETKQFIFPFLAHAIGTLIGACIAALTASNKKMIFAYTIGFTFLLGGISMVFYTKGEPLWFCIVDLILAYIPMAWIGGKIGVNISKNR